MDLLWGGRHRLHDWDNLSCQIAHSCVWQATQSPAFSYTFPDGHTKVNRARSNCKLKRLQSKGSRGVLRGWEPSAKGLHFFLQAGGACFNSAHINCLDLLWVPTFFTCKVTPLLLLSCRNFKRIPPTPRPRAVGLFSSIMSSQPWPLVRFSKLASTSSCLSPSSAATCINFP